MAQKKHTLGATELSENQLIADQPIPLYRILEEECRLMAEWPESEDQRHRDYLAKTSEAVGAADEYERARRHAGTPPGNAARMEAFQRKEDAEIACLDPLNAILHTAKRSALCISGGGIRSATFALGVIQGLARLQVLDKFDYLSTVSGGGYIGSWLSAWVQRVGDISIVSKILAAEPVEPIDPEPAPIRHLRAYSNYLNPAAGLLSSDTWTLASTVVRNIFLNWLILIPAIAFVLLLPRLFLSVIVAPMPLAWHKWLGMVAIVLAGAAFAYAFRYLPLELPAFGDRKSDQKRFLIQSLAPLLAAAALFTTGVAWLQQVPGQTPHVWHFIAFGALTHMTGWIVSGRATAVSLLGTALTGVIAGALAYAVFVKSLPIALSDPALYVTFAFPLVLVIVGLLGALFIGLVSKYTEDEDREWWARSGAWVMISGVVWLGTAFIGIYGPIGLMESPALLQKAIAALGGITGVIAILLGKSAETSSGKTRSADAPTSLPKEWLMKIATPIFTVLLLAAIATGAEWLRIECLSGQVWGMYPEWQIERAPWFQLMALLAFFAVLSAVASRFVNVNIFSLHAMYRDRLIRAYVGASRESNERHPNLFTGQDPDDNVQMYQLKQLPFHILNIALNLVKGTNLAWQQRKAESFTVSPMHWGSYRIGYRPSDCVLKETGNVTELWRNISLGTAAAISGAAASPNMGYQSSPLLTFLMTMFNARLGWWLGNPGAAGKHTWYERGPRFALKPLVAELLGLTNDESSYVNLSDGGHFENLALYEMVLRRCHYIVVVDSGCDPDYKFEDLGNAVRKIRIDLGISIEFPSIEISSWAQQKRSNTKGSHYATGRICYSCVDPNAPDGCILYIKPTLNGNEPRDVLHYASTDPSFPQQPTLTDQWYDESQFESYRRLGHHTIEELAHFDEKPMPLSQLFTTTTIAAEQ
ncbi:MAG: patatin-like phospholipase family protein [Acidobacteriota bacterium]|nr:patatin-like phospholipase family protein [Acidobacteriota bacterium]